MDEGKLLCCSNLVVTESSFISLSAPHALMPDGPILKSLLLTQPPDSGSHLMFSPCKH